MKNHANYDVYLASPLFSAAERAFNASLTEQLRSKSITVFAPQELSANHIQAPTEAQIFCGDTSALLRSSLVLAVLDGEAIDAGVAAEIGIAVASHIPVIGLWTDIRQTRVGSSRMYRNVYVTGAIRHNGLIVGSPLEATELCLSLLSAMPKNHQVERERMVSTAHSRSIHQPAVSQFFCSAYTPPFLHNEFILELIEKYAGSDIKMVVDFGCGFGELASVIKSRYPVARYVGVDPVTVNPRGGPIYSQVPKDVTATADVLVLSFVLHDYIDKRGLLVSLQQILSPNGTIILLDLEKSDLPILTQTFEHDLLRLGPSADMRLSGGTISHLASQVGLSVVDCGLVSRQILFPSYQSLHAYTFAYGIDQGYDLGLFRFHSPGLPSAIEATLANLEFPFHDFRTFIYAALR